MSSNPGQNHTSKAVNIPNKSSSSFHSAPAIDSGTRRAGGSGSFGAGLASRSSGSPRNNQSHRNQHKRQRRPRLLDDDIDEPVGGLSPVQQVMQLTECLDHHEINKQPQGTDVHNSFNEFLSSSSARIPSSATKPASLQLMGPWLWLSCNGQGPLCTCKLPLYCSTEQGILCASSQC